MKNLGKIIGGLCVCALAVGLIPYQISRDEDTGACTVRSLLWACRKTPVGDKFNYNFAMPPSGLGCNDAEEA